MMGAYYTLLGLLVFMFVYSNGAQHKPASNYFKICNEKDGKLLNECIKSTMLDLKPVLAKGIPELGMPSIEPMVIDRMIMSNGQGNFKLIQTLYDLKIYGVSDYDVKEISANLQNLTFHTVMFQKKLDFDGKYEMDGQILVIPVKGKGEVTYNFTDVTTTFDTVLERYKRDGVEYVRVKNSTLTIEPQSAHSHFTNLFNGDKMLGDSTNKFLNDNWKEAFDTFRYLPETAFAKVFTVFANNIYDKFPLKELYPSVY
ncbi:hypothetical protein O3M35_010060 [Rhynocoris fuscipes]|uniref:Protein takeout n=1 Tax=Rhynocoris fuscipes TaxID=488301 RepID=A0AAW1CYI3_9HEMI